MRPISKIIDLHRALVIGALVGTMFGIALAGFEAKTRDARTASAAFEARIRPLARAAEKKFPPNGVAPVWAQAPLPAPVWGPRE